MKPHRLPFLPRSATPIWVTLLVITLLLLIGPAAAETSATPEPIDLNRATIAELIALPGIGEERARNIVEFRLRRPFRRRLDLLRVPGIGRRTYRRLRELIRVTPAAPSPARETSQTAS